MRNLKIYLMIMLAVVLPALAETKMVTGNKQQETFTLGSGDTLHVMGNQNILTAKGGNVSVMGNQNQMRLEGQGNTGDVTGNENTVTVDGNWSAINVTGNDNTIKLVKRPGMKEPKITRFGKNTQVVTVEP